MHNKKYWFVLIGLLFGSIFLLWNYRASQEATDSMPESEVEVTGKVTDALAAEACLSVLKQNLAAANQKDVEQYVHTLVASAREETAAEMTVFFTEYDLVHELLSFEVIKQEDDAMLIAAQQKTSNHGARDYRNHITQAHHTFVLEENEWKIQQTVMTNTQFL